jgi:transcriptional regulator with GAF, ATPase, and Fis domain
MALVAFSTSISEPQADLHPFERLAVRLSSSFSALGADEVEASVARALAEIGTTFSVDECTLMVYRDRSASIVQSWASPPHPPCTDQDLASMPWLVQRLARNAVVSFTPTADLPHAARTDFEQASASGVEARLAVPVVVGSRVTYGLMIGSRRWCAEWRAPVIERLRLLGEILGAGLARVWHHEPESARMSDPEPESPSPTAKPSSPSATAKQGFPSPSPVDGLDLDATNIVGDSVPLRAALRCLAQVAPLDTTVLLLGETGTGKELFASALHEASRRRGKPLVRVNCAALPPTLIESELFGHERGAFTGASALRHGRFELADGGTILLDEVGDLALELQAKLLRVLQEGEFERVGSSKTRRVDVRVIAATHVDLEAAVLEGRFRADLYYRLSVFPVRLPALRERPEDIPTLVQFFIQRHQRDLGRRITSVAPDTMAALQRYDWPGNIRELENVVARAMIRSADGVLRLDDPPAASVHRSTAPSRASEGDSLDTVQRLHIERVLRECGGRINGAGNAAVRLGLHPNTLRFRIKKLGVAMPERQGSATQPSAAHLA